MQANNVLFFLPSKTLNEATNYYVEIIKKGFIESGYNLAESSNIQDIRSYEKVFVMSAKWCFIAKLINPRANVITWFQGLGAEEALLTRGSYRDKFIWSILEKFAIKHSFLSIYVSKSMRNHYLTKYKTIDNDYFIMPCFNKSLNMKALDYPAKYVKPTFVYAGSLDKWQCIEETLELYSLIEKKIPEASLTILTKQKVVAEQLTTKFNLQNVTIDFVPLEKLDSLLQTFKYGFLIRQDHIINRVSTPTKMNSYLANGIIPIYTNVINDFDENLDVDNLIQLNHNSPISFWAEKIINEERNSSFDLESYKSSLKRIFSEYYSSQFYIEELKERFLSYKSQR